MFRRTKKTGTSTRHLPSPGADKLEFETKILAQALVLQSVAVQVCLCAKKTLEINQLKTRIQIKNITHKI